MPGAFEIKDGVLRKYRGGEAHVSIPEGVTEIGAGAFYGCEGLTVTCPRDSYAWGYCKGEGIPVKPESTQP